MIKYCKILNEETGLVQLGAGCSDEYYEEIGMKQRDVQQSDIDFQWYIAELCPIKTPEQKEQEEKERIANLSLTKREVFLALYKDKKITPEQLRSQITDTEALIEFDYANDYFRGNPLIDKIGIMLGYSMEDLDYLFEHKELPNREEDEEVPNENIDEPKDNQ